MKSRRQFLQRAAVAAAAVGAGQTSAQQPGQTRDDCKPLPPSIASLKSMQHLATPITAEERAARIDKARQLMSSNRLDAILLMEGTSLEYFTGVHWWGGERLFALVVPVTGASLCVCPAFEEGRAREQLARTAGSGNLDLRVWQEDDNPYQLLARALSDHGMATGSLGIEETVRFVFSQGIAKAAPQARLKSGTPVTAGCRGVKSDHEVELMRLAAKVTLAAYEAAYRSLREGMTRAEFEGLINAAYDKLGFPGEVDVQVGQHSSSPHGSVEAQVIRDGSIVMIDDGCKVEGYTSDITRTFVVGKPTDKMKQVFDVVHRAQTAALKTARPGVQCQEVDAAARKVIIDAGFGPGYKFFAHRVGHGIGMDMHEWPYLVRGNTLPLQPNMTFSDEPGIYIPGEFGIRLEDDMHITADGAELFTPQSPSLEDPFGS